MTNATTNAANLLANLLANLTPEQLVQFHQLPLAEQLAVEKRFAEMTR